MVCKVEDGHVADKLREEQSVVNQDLSNTLEGVEQKNDRPSEVEVAIEALGSRLKSLEYHDPQDLVQRMRIVKKSTEKNQASLECIK